MVVASPIREVVVCTRITLGYPLEFEGKVLEVDLIVFSLLGFKISLGMDWLFQHYANINCSWLVSFQLPKGDVIDVVEDGVHPKAKRDLAKRA